MAGLLAQVSQVSYKDAINKLAKASDDMEQEIANISTLTPPYFKLGTRVSNYAVSSSSDSYIANEYAGYVPIGWALLYPRDYWIPRIEWFNYDAAHRTRIRFVPTGLSSNTESSTIDYILLYVRSELIE